MIDGRKLQIDPQEIFRYLGYRKDSGQQIDLFSGEFADQVEKELRTKCRIRYVYRRVSVTLDGEGRLHFGGLFAVESKGLRRSLENCKEAFLMAATLGAEADLLISRYCRLAMNQGVIAEAAATAVIEAGCDFCCEQLEQELAEEGYRLHRRFSPGYGDFSLDCQKYMIDALDCPRKIGLSLTDQCMLVPTKSVTAVMGISSLSCAEDEDGACENCLKKDCTYRRID